MPDIMAKMSRQEVVKVGGFVAAIFFVMKFSGQAIRSIALSQVAFRRNLKILK